MDNTLKAEYLKENLERLKKLKEVPSTGDEEEDFWTVGILEDNLWNFISEFLDD